MSLFQQTLQIQLKQLIYIPDRNYQNKIEYSECRILKVLTLSEWNQNLFTETLFSKLFPTYILIPRLQTSWYNTLFLEISSHSWFFFFDKNCPKHFPHWFLHWWQLHFGLDGKTFPTSAKQGFDLFMSKTQKPPL